MHNYTRVRSLSALVFVLCVASPALAIPTTYVSRSGSGTVCTLTAPCATLQAAHNAADAGGTVRVLDMGEYGPITITKSITIQAKPGDALLTGNAGGGLTVNINAADTDTVVLQGLDLDGTSLGGQLGGNGIIQTKAASVYIIDCTIKNYGTGVWNFSTTTGARMFVQRSNILRTQYGAYAAGNGRVVSILDSLIDNATVGGVGVETGAIIGLVRSIINASPVAIRINGGGGQVVSIGPSNIVSGTGAFTATAPFN